MDEAALIARARAGDPNAFRALYDANVDRVYRLMYRMAGEEDLAKDFTQDAFVRAYQRLHQFRGDAAFSTWLHSIAVSVALNGLRLLRRHWKREQDLDDNTAVAAGEPIVDPGVKKRLYQAIDGLDEIYRSVVLMHDLEGYTHEAISDTLNVAVGTSKARLFRARGMLREALRDIAEEYV